MQLAAANVVRVLLGNVVGLGTRGEEIACPCKATSGNWFEFFNQIAS